MLCIVLQAAIDVVGAGFRKPAVHDFDNALFDRSGLQHPAVQKKMCGCASPSPTPAFFAACRRNCARCLVTAGRTHSSSPLPSGGAPLRLRRRIGGDDREKAIKQKRPNFIARHLCRG